MAERDVARLRLLRTAGIGPVTWRQLLARFGTGEDGCAVCLEDLEGGDDDKLRAMPCSHCFHQRCIFRWLSVSRVCPCCRFPLPSADEQRLLALDEQATGPNTRAETN